MARSIVYSYLIWLLLFAAGLGRWGHFNELSAEDQGGAQGVHEGDNDNKHASKKEKEQKKKRGNNAPVFMMPKDAWSVASVVVARPGATTIDVNVLAAQNIRGCFEYALAGADKKVRSDEQDFKAGEPSVIHLAGLQPDSQYEYRLLYREDDQKELSSGPQYSFHTRRSPGSSFLFEIQGDSHPERNQQHDPLLYAQVLKAASTDHPDFYLTIGDDFSVDTLRDITRQNVDSLYLHQRYYLGLVGHSAPVFLVNGNHEQAARCNLDGTENNVAVWAQNAREKYFSQPAPDGFYSGDNETVEHIGLLRDYYAWTWGDALFVVIDPYWHTEKPVDNVLGGGEKNKDMWDITLGDAQYHWLQQTLEQSKAAYKFVFTHHVLGRGRGGIECAQGFEWGGKNKKGVVAFAEKRPGWALPIHQLMVKNQVTIFFQGHDHVFCKQELDGVIYQSLPEPANPSYTLYNQDAYKSGDVFPNSGRVRVAVSPEMVRVEYIRAYLTGTVPENHRDGEIAYSYDVLVRKISK